VVVANNQRKHLSIFSGKHRIFNIKAGSTVTTVLLKLSNCTAVIVQQNVLWLNVNRNDTVGISFHFLVNCLSAKQKNV
jgi:hypothetical protein